MADPTTDNQVAGVINDILKNVIEGAGVPVIEATMIADMPWLALPVVRQIFEYLLSKVAGYFYIEAAHAATKIVIDVQVNMEESAVINTFQTLQMAIASGDQDAIKKASDDLDGVYASLGHSDGSAPA